MKKQAETTRRTSIIYSVEILPTMLHYDPAKYEPGRKPPPA